MSLRDHLAAIWARRWLVVLASVVVAGVVYAAVAARADVYQADTLLRLSVDEAGGGRNEDDASFLGRSYARLATTDPVLDDAIDRSGLDISQGTARGRVETSVDDGYVRLVVDGPSPGEAEALASAMADALAAGVAEQQERTRQAEVAPLEEDLARVTRQLEDPPELTVARRALELRVESILNAITELSADQPASLLVTEPANAGDEPVAPQPARAAVLALLVALVVNAELAVGLALLGDRFGSVGIDEEVTDLTGLAVLSRVPAGRPAQLVEAFRVLRTNVLLMRPPPRSLAVTASDAGAGASSTAWNLASSLSSASSVVLVDADLRSPTVHRLAEVSRSPGLTEVLQGLPVASALNSVPTGGGLRVLTAGAPTADPAALLTKEAVRSLLDDLAWADAVVIDVSSGSVAEGMAAAAACDASLVVLDAAHSERRAVRDLVAQLRRVGASPIGIVVNRVGRAPRWRRPPPSSPEPLASDTTLAPSGG